LNKKVINQFFAHILTLSPGNLAEFNHRVEESELRNFLEEHCTDFRKRDKICKN